MVAEDRGRISWRMDSVGSRFSTAERIWMKYCPPVQVKMSAVHQNGALSPVWVLYSISPVKNLYVHTILFQLPL